MCYDKLRLCGVHFEDSMFSSMQKNRLKLTAIPTTIEENDCNKNKINQSSMCSSTTVFKEIHGTKNEISESSMCSNSNILNESDSFANILESEPNSSNFIVPFLYLHQKANGSLIVEVLKVLQEKGLISDSLPQGFTRYANDGANCIELDSVLTTINPDVVKTFHILTEPPVDYRQWENVTEQNAFVYVCGYLGRKCFELHNL
ncbi:hypothetical protein ILUMI_05440 [Ignelater luminosus]|uniref:THAP-type domain-containing protein n=1 Tax=Ignelater luminosus TaxID=2038154 RepID=A0A8K0DCI9_IGNLU|nr:hypothetical protein ILUMI_05440 [Ignelater luminosus]